MTKYSAIAAILLVTAVSGCTWVKLTSEGETIAVMNSADAACKRLALNTHFQFNHAEWRPCGDNDIIDSG